MKLKSLLRTTLFYAERWHFSACWCLMSYAPTQRHCNNQKKILNEDSENIYGWFADNKLSINF